MSQARPLWESKHPYYCNQGNYFASGLDQPGTEHETFDDFMAEEGDSDFDYNLLFRWDWEEGEKLDLAEDEDEYEGEPLPFNGDVNFRNGHLLLFFMGQRKGLYRWVKIKVCRADEPAVRDYLKPRLDHLLSLWRPLTDV